MENKTKYIIIIFGIIGGILALIGTTQTLQHGLWYLTNDQGMSPSLIWSFFPIIFGMLGLIFAILLSIKEKKLQGILVIIFGILTAFFSYSLTLFFVIGAEIAYVGVIGGIIIIISGILGLIKK